MQPEQVFRAIADPHRRRLLDSLARSDGQTLTELCAILPMSRIGVMKHLHILEDAGLVTTRKIGRERLHSLDPAPLIEIDAWLTGYRRLWNERMDRLQDLIDRTHSPQEPQEETDAEP